jgi:hypothetical protein
LILGLLFPGGVAVEKSEFSVGVYYLYHYDKDLIGGWREETSEAMGIALGRLSGVAILSDYRFTYRVVGAFRIDSVEFGNGTVIPEFDGNRTMNRILDDLLSPGSTFQSAERDFNLTIFVFPLSKCVSKQYIVVSDKGVSPIFLSYNAVLAEIHFDRYAIEHEILHTLGLPDRNCDEGIRCTYPDDPLSVMAVHPEHFYLSRGDYVDFQRQGLNKIDLTDVAVRQGSSKLYDPRLGEDGACVGGLKSTREWRLVYGE